MLLVALPDGITADQANKNEDGVNALLGQNRKMK